MPAAVGVTPPYIMNDLFAAVRNRNHDDIREILARSPESVRLRDGEGATALHYAAELGDRRSVEMLLDAGADINARDSRFQATPAGWAIEHLRERGALLGMEIEDAREAIGRGDEAWIERWLSRLPALRDAVDGDGTPLEEHAANSGNPAIVRLFTSHISRTTPDTARSDP
ncbi:MAG TPA: ankyrin repeat domain-containing protein [Thermoanaerobaculia bacterium]|nr:ankyrin repeat domain-containing protein [Thermoanaerobaculia bacterium]